MTPRPRKATVREAAAGVGAGVEVVGGVEGVVDEGRLP